MHSPKYYVLLSLVLSLCAVFLLLPGQALSKGKEPVRIGVTLEFTGPWANMTKVIRMAMEMEAERVNAQGGVQGRPLEFIFKDNAFDAAQASSDVLQFAKDKSILAVVGPIDTLQIPVRAVAEREKILNINFTPSSPELRQLKQRWCFNISQNDIIVSQKLVDLCQARGYKKVMLFPGNWPLAQSLAAYFKAEGQKKSIQAIISQETHKPTDIDMSPQLIKLLPVMETEKVDAFYAVTGGPTGPITCKNLRSLGSKIPILGTHAFGFDFIIDLGGEAMEGVEFPSGKAVAPDALDEKDPAKAVILGFDQRMKAKYGMPANQMSGHGYDAVWLLHDALRLCKGNITRASLRDSLEKTKDFKGCTGIYTYSAQDHDGLTKKDLIFVRIEGGKFKRITFPGME